MTEHQRCWRTYDIPAGRTWESFRYLVEHLDTGHPVDECVTDSEAERDRLVTDALRQGYEPRVTWRRLGTDWCAA